MECLTRIEKRLLYGTVGSTIFGAFILIITISTDHWINLDFPYGIYRNSTNSYTTNHHSGLWRICRTELHNSTSPAYTQVTCSLIKLFPSSQTVDDDPEVDDGILNYSRSETAFAIISLVFAVFAHIFAIYAIREPRYMFKRLAGMLYLIAAVCVLVAIEVLMNSVSYEKENLDRRHPIGSTLSYGYSFVLSWFVFLIYIAAAIVYFVCSKKRKRDAARDEKEAQENEPVHLGRI